MPLRWEILHEQTLVHVMAEGAVTLKEREAHFDELRVANALGHGKLFDASRAKRPAKPFKTEAEAPSWLVKVADQVADQRTRTLGRASDPPAD